MNNNNILAMTKKLENEKEKAELKLMKMKIKIEIERVIDLCPHEIVIKYSDNHSRKLIVGGNYYCPICGKSIGTNNNEFFSKTAFKNSRVIDLNNISLMGNSETLHNIKKAVIGNIDLYYNSNATDEELASRLEETLKSNIYDYHKMTLNRKIN